LTVPVSILAAILMALITLFAQLWLFNELVFGVARSNLYLASIGLLGCGLLFALFCESCCRWIADRSTPLPVWLAPMLKNVANGFNLLQPEIHLLKTAGLNAFALQGFSKRGHILLNAAVLTQLNQDEVEAVLAHECSHIASHHALLLTVVQGMILPVTLPLASLAGLFYAFIYGLDKFRSAVLTLNHIMSVLLFPLTSIGLALFSRNWEFEADRQAALVIGSDKYIAALRCLHGSFFQHPNLLDISADSNAQVSRHGWALSHPSLSQRINALLEIGQRG
jgi:heat shock protein HtpX